MSKKAPDPVELTPEQQKLAAEMAQDFEKLIDAEAKPEEQAAPKVEEPRPSEPERFYSGGATAEEIACYREAHGG
jgi:hypothetical protein